jgi:protein-tyrosine phosphatase
MTETYKRHLGFKSVSNFRDIGGYSAREGRTVAWRRVFRSGEFARLTGDDYRILKEEIRLATVIDLRSAGEIERQGKGLLAGADIRYHNVSFIADGGDRKADERRFKELKNMGEFYVDIIRQKDYGKRIIEALEVIAEPANHPLVFHCAVGKDRTGILAAVLLSVLGVEDKDIIEDYSLSGPYMEEMLKNLNNDPGIARAAQALPEYFWKAAPESMTLFLATLRKEYGSVPGYLGYMGCEPSLTERLERALLVQLFQG